MNVTRAYVMENASKKLWYFWKNDWWLYWEHNSRSRLLEKFAGTKYVLTLGLWFYHKCNFGGFYVWLGNRLSCCTGGSGHVLLANKFMLILNAVLEKTEPIPSTGNAFCNQITEKCISSAADSKEHPSWEHFKKKLVYPYWNFVSFYIDKCSMVLGPDSWIRSHLNKDENS